MSHVYLTKFLIKKDENLELKIGGDFDQNGGEAGIDPNRRRKPPIGGGMGTLNSKDVTVIRKRENTLYPTPAMTRYIIY